MLQYVFLISNRQSPEPRLLVNDQNTRVSTKNEVAMMHDVMRQRTYLPALSLI
jgi:hypothetical protein